MHLFSILLGLVYLTSAGHSEPRLDPIAYHQSIFRPKTRTTPSPKQDVIPVNRTAPIKMDNPLQLLTGFFNNADFVGKFGELLEYPKHQAAAQTQPLRPLEPPKPVSQQFLPHNLSALNTQYSLDEVPQTKDQVAEVGNFEWKKLLLGPDGLLTHVFNEFKEQRKTEIDKTKAQVPQADLNPEQNDLAKLFEAFLLKTKNGNFDEPLPELPFIGICNRLSCGDIYKAVDEFRKSEFFSNFQTAISLLHDAKGLDIIGEVLANPDLIENFVSSKDGGGLSEIFSGQKQVTSKTPKYEIIDEDEDFGVDLSAVESGKQVTGAKKPDIGLPQISSNLDYYSSVDTNAGTIVKDEQIPEHVDVEVEEQIPSTNETVVEMPEISESIDAMPQDYSVVIEEVVPMPKEVETITRPSRVLTGLSSTTPATTFRTTTKKNFRIKDDYYSMYYSD